MFVDYPLIIERLASQRLVILLNSYKKVFCSKLLQLVEAVLTLIINYSSWPQLFERWIALSTG